MKPKTSSQAFHPEPTLDDSIYQAILDIIQDTGIVMERLPTVYVGKNEESLRDHLILNLSPHFQSVTGETFNVQGKTDILIRDNGANVFVAECKVWKGTTACMAAIDQLLSYLTWRDSKAALVLFVHNQELGPVLRAVEGELPTHPCFITYRGQPKPARFMFEFHFPNDPTRSVHMAVLCFHLPNR